MPKFQRMVDHAGPPSYQKTCPRCWMKLGAMTKHILQMMVQEHDEVCKE